MADAFLSLPFANANADADADADEECRGLMALRAGDVMLVREEL